MRVAVGLVLLLAVLPARADTWTHDFGGSNYENPGAIRQTADGGFLLAGDTSFDVGFTQPGPYWHLWAVRIDASGNRLWVAYYPDGGDSRATGAAPRSDGGWMLTGSYWDAHSFYNHALLLAVDASGALLYARQLGDSEPTLIRSIVPTTDGRFVTVGNTGFGVWGMKVAASGSIVWSYRYSAHASEVSGPRRDEWGVAAEPTPDGGALIGGLVSNKDPKDRYSTGFTDTDIAIEKVDADGQVVWSRTYGSIDSDELADLKRTADGGILVLGSTRPTASSPQSAWVLRLDASGNVLWQETVTTESTGTAGVSVAPSPDGTAAVLLSVSRGNGHLPGTALVRLGSLGEVLWARMSLDLFAPAALARASNGDYLLTTSVAGNMRAVRVLDDALAPDCSGLVEGFRFLRTATTAPSTSRRVSRHTFTPTVSSVPVAVEFPYADLGAVCP